MKKRLAILVSGGGTNMQAVISAAKTGKINAEVALVISSNDSALALGRAAHEGIHTAVCSISDFGGREARDRRIVELLLEHKIDIVVLAGYLGIITNVILDFYADRIINIHPSLLPKFGGRDFYGIKVHEAVLAAGEKVTGATVHYVDSGTDTGKIIKQKEVEICPDDTSETLQRRVLAAEHELLTEVLAEMCKN